MAAPTLVAPVMLLAMPQVADPFFRKSVVLLLAHQDEGSFGFIVNRATELKVAEILRDLEIDWRGDPAVQARFGGPVQPQVGTVLFAGGEEVPELPGATEVLPGLRLSQNLSELARLAAQPPARLRLLLGYAGWGAGQLVEEIVRNDWLTAPVDDALIFGEAGEATWERGLRSVGVDPRTLPAWTESDGDGAPN
ncbi:MAG: YqgE/AlgH family protein [Thermoanaerobaculia bacterium]|nr:YqgE/AlgH family protein [Thermoanaerobaculia bacterium]